MSRASVVLTFLQIIALFWWVNLQLIPSHTTSWNFWFNGFYGAVFLTGGFIGLFSITQVGGTRSSIGNALLYTSGGIVMYGIGQFVWLGYNLIGTDVPYPSIADFFFVSFVPLVAVGFWHIFKIFKTEMKRRIIMEFVLTLLVVATIVLTFINQPDLNRELSLGSRLLNMYYPLADSFMIAIAIFTFRLSSDKFNKTILFFIAGLLSHAIADFLFTYNTTQGLYWNGDFSDLLFSIGGFFMGMGVITLVDSFTMIDRSKTGYTSQPLSL